MISGREDDALYIFDNTSADGIGLFTGMWKKLPDNAYYTNLKDIDFNDKISAMWVHPRVNVRATADANFMGNSMFKPGTELTGNVTATDLKTAGLFDNISSLQANAVMSQAAWQLKCCRNEVGPYTDAQKCGKYWSQDPSVCGSLDCAEKLATDGVCQTWCRNHPSQCDTLKINFCKDHPDSNLCGCILDTPAARSERALYPAITAPRQCWGSSDCQKTDLYDTLITTDLKPTNCPDINAQIQNIINSTIVGSNLSMVSNTNNGSSAAGSNFLIWLIIIILIVAAASIAVIFWDPQLD
jgi:hypothetical protein